MTRDNQNTERFNPPNQASLTLGTNQKGSKFLRLSIYSTSTLSSYLTVSFNFQLRARDSALSRSCTSDMIHIHAEVLLISKKDIFQPKMLFKPEESLENQIYVCTSWRVWLFHEPADRLKTGTWFSLGCSFKTFLTRGNKTTIQCIGRSVYIPIRCYQWLKKIDSPIDSERFKCTRTT